MTPVRVHTVECHQEYTIVQELDTFNMTIYKDGQVLKALKGIPSKFKFSRHG